MDLSDLIRKVNQDVYRQTNLLTDNSIKTNLLIKILVNFLDELN